MSSAPLLDPAGVACFLRETGAAIVDVRDADAFARAHLRGSGHVSAGSLERRLHELPFRRATPILIVGDAALDEAVALLAREGYALVRAASFDDAERSGIPLEPGPRAARLWQPTRLV